MKISYSKKYSNTGFTLVELLVVIAIIAALSTAAFTAGRGAILKAQKVKSQTIAIDIAAAVEGFYSDYSVYPAIASDPAGQVLSVDATGAGDVGIATDGDGANGTTLMHVLTASEGAAPVYNTRNITFLTGKVATAALTPGIHYTPGGAGAVAGTYSYCDYNGTPFRVYYDNNYDEQVNNPFNAAAAPIRRGVIVVGQGSAPAFSAANPIKDFVLTW